MPCHQNLLARLRSPFVAILKTVLIRVGRAVLRIGTVSSSYRNSAPLGETTSGTRAGQRAPLSAGTCGRGSLVGIFTWGAAVNAVQQAARHRSRSSAAERTPSRGSAVLQTPPAAAVPSM